MRKESLARQMLLNDIVEVSKKLSFLDKEHMSKIDYGKADLSYLLDLKNAMSLLLIAEENVVIDCKIKDGSWKGDNV